MLYASYQNEADFRERFVKPLLNRLGFHGVTELHGSQEFGKDFVFSEIHRLGGVKHYAAQVKHHETISQGRQVDQLVTQARQAFSTAFRRPDSPRDCHVSAVYIFNSGGITPNARDQMLNELSHERFGDNVHFLDGARLESLNNWATLQTDAVTRSRLLGLRACLRAIKWDLEENHLQGKEILAPIYVHGIELYLSEPVNSDDQLIGCLFSLWSLLQGIERLRRIHPPTSAGAKKLQPNIVRLATSALPRVSMACELVEAAIGKLRPIE